MVGYVGLTTVVYPVHIDELWVQCVRARPCQTTELPCWLNEVCKAHSAHIVTLLNEKELHNTYWSNWKSTSLNICLKIVCKTVAKKESWSESWRYQNTCMIVGVIGTGLQSPRTNNSTHLRVEKVGGHPRNTLPWITTSTMRFRCWFMFEVLQATTIQRCLLWGRQCLLRCTRNILRGKRTRSGCGRNQSGPRGTAMPSCGKPLKTIENHGKACLAQYVVGFAAVVNYVQIEELSVQHVQACPCQNYEADHAGWMRFARRTVTYSEVAIRKGPSWNILMPLEVEQVWTSVWHTQRKSPEVCLGGIQTLGLSLVSLVRYDLFIVAAWNKLEDVDGLPLITASITRLPFIHVRSVGNQTAYSEDEHVNSVASRASSGWEEPKRTKRNCNAIIRKTHENPWTPWKTWVAL